MRYKKIFSLILITISTAVHPNRDKSELALLQKQFINSALQTSILALCSVILLSQGVQEQNHYRLCYHDDNKVVCNANPTPYFIFGSLTGLYSVVKCLKVISVERRINQKESRTYQICDQV